MSSDGFMGRIRFKYLSWQRMKLKFGLRQKDVFSVGGHRMLLNPDSKVDAWLIKKGPWEPKQQTYLFALAREQFGSAKESIFFDVGACFGLYSITASTTGMFKKIHCFEPDRDNRSQLYANLFLNDLNDLVEVHGFGASDQDAQLPFTSGKQQADHNFGGAQITRDADRADCFIEVRRVDGILSLCNEKIVMKMDVEGHELFALAGMERLITTNEVVLQVEAFEESFPKVRERLQACCFAYQHTIGDDHYFVRRKG